jgi:hypothetical protein
MQHRFGEGWHHRNHGCAEKCGKHHQKQQRPDIAGFFNEL